MHLGEPTIPISWYGCRIEHAESLTIIHITANKYHVPDDLPMTMSWGHETFKEQGYFVTSCTQNFQTNYRSRRISDIVGCSKNGELPDHQIGNLHHLSEGWETLTYQDKSHQTNRFQFCVQACTCCPHMAPSWWYLPLMIVIFFRCSFLEQLPGTEPYMLWPTHGQQQPATEADADFVSHRYLVYNSSPEIKHALPLFTS